MRLAGRWGLCLARAWTWTGIAQIVLPATAMKTHNVAACAVAFNVQTKTDPTVASRN